MAQFKVISTVTWIVQADSLEQGLVHARESLDRILDTNPVGDEYQDFCVQLDLAALREKKGLIHIAVFPIDVVFGYVTEEDTKQEFVVDGATYLVRMNSDRYHVFRQNRTCVACGLVGTQMILDLNPGDLNAHFNLYGEENGRLILMTKDHIVPKSKGGENNLTNYATMCCICNNLKGDANLTLEECRELRQLHKNEAKLPRKELRELINMYRRKLTLKES